MDHWGSLRIFCSVLQTVKVFPKAVFSLAEELEHGKYRRKLL